MPECPTCGDEFDTRRGLGVHHSSVHDERLPNRECDRCGTEFYCDYEKRYCSDECHDEAVSYEGENNPNYRGGTETAECVLCESEFEYYECEKEGLYCPDCVEDASWRELPDISGENNPRWNGGKREYECEMCDSRFERHPGNAKTDVTLCSRSCLQDWVSEAFTGEGHPNWKGGGNQEYGPGWNEARKNALERDGHECRVCGTTAEDLGRNPDVHHIVPVRAFADAEDRSIVDAHVLDNLVSLCPACHRKAEFGKIDRDRLYDLIGATDDAVEAPT